MVFRPTVYKARAIGVSLTLVRDNYGLPCGIALYINFLLGGVGFSVERNPKEPAMAGKAK